MNNKRIIKSLQNCWSNKSYRIGFIMIIIIIMIAIFENQFALQTYNVGNMSIRLQPPSAEHWFGTDEYGRDVYSRTIFGTRLALRSAVLGSMIEFTIGITLGLIAGYYGGWIDHGIMFIGDMIWSLPSVIIAMAIVMVLGKSLDNVIIALALAGWPRYTRIVRAKTMSLRNMPFIETGKAFGENSISLLVRYILPNIMPSMIVMASISMPGFIGATTTLSFLGMGAQAPSPDWGLAISRGASLIYRAPWLAIFPCIALMYTIISFSLFGEGLRDMVDPHMQLK